MNKWRDTGGWDNWVESFFSSTEQKELAEFLKARPRILSKILDEIKVTVGAKVLDDKITLEEWQATIELAKLFKTYLSKK